MELILVRHGESEANRNGIVSSDPSEMVGLTDTGIAEAKMAGHLLEQRLKQPVKRLLYSPLLRTRMSAEIIENILGDLVETSQADDRLRENGFGEWSGRKQTEVNDAIEKVHNQWFVENNWDMRMGISGESRREFHERIRSLLIDIISSTEDNDAVIAVTHSSVIAVIERYWMSAYDINSPRHAAKTGEVKSLSLVDGGEKLHITLNDAI